MLIFLCSMDLVASIHNAVLRCTVQSSTCTYMCFHVFRRYSDCLVRSSQHQIKLCSFLTMAVSCVHAMQRIIGILESRSGFQTGLDCTGLDGLDVDNPATEGP